MNAGPCPECGEQLSADQRYCISCGHRVQAPLAPSYLPAPLGAGERGEARRRFPIPIPIASTFAAVALGFGVVMGTAISPNLSELVAGEYAAGPVVAEAPEPGQGKGGDKSGDGSPASAGSSDFGFEGGAGFYGSTGGGFGTTGGGGSEDDGNGTGGVAVEDIKKKKPKPDHTFLSGTVVHQNPVAGSYSISSGGGLSAIHTKAGLPVVGTKLKVPIRVLANGTYAEDAGRQNQGTATTARFTAVVTDSREGLIAGDPDLYTLSGRGASVLVYAPDPAAITPSPVVGSLLTTTVDIRGAVTQTLPPPLPPGSCPPPATALPTPPIFPGKQLIQAAPPGAASAPVTAAVIETVVQASCPTPPASVLSADDVREGAADLTLTLSPAIDPARLIAGQALMASVAIAGGLLTEVTGTAGDQGINGADDAASGQGDLLAAAAAADRRIARAAKRSRARAAERSRR